MARQSLYEMRKDAIVDTIAKLHDAHGQPPSLREVASVTDISVATLHSYLMKLRQEGIVEWSDRSHRSLKIRRQPAVQPATPGLSLNGAVSVP
jgi:SOS-response transcriptional repressor LexA